MRHFVLKWNPITVMQPMEVHLQSLSNYAKKNQIRYAKFANRSDIPGGGTIGSILSSFIPAKTIDVGIPLLAMHSARELMAADSQCQLNALFQAFFTEE